MDNSLEKSYDKDFEILSNSIIAQANLGKSIPWSSRKSQRRPKKQHNEIDLGLEEGSIFGVRSPAA